MNIYCEHCEERVSIDEEGSLTTSCGAAYCPHSADALPEGEPAELDFSEDGTREYSADFFDGLDVFEEGC